LSPHCETPILVLEPDHGGNDQPAARVAAAWDAIEPMERERKRPVSDR